MKKVLLILFVTVLLSACGKEIDSIRPLTQVDEQGEFLTAEGIAEATAGNYFTLHSDGFIQYSEPRFSIGEGRGDNVTLQLFGTPNKISDAFLFRNSPDPESGMSAEFFKGAYHMITNVNRVLTGISTMEANGGFASLTEANKNIVRYAKGENLLLRAMTYFNLARVYGRPYYQSAGNGPCVPIKLTSALDEKPAVSTVKQVYDYLIADLKLSAQLMKAPVTKSNSFASTYAAWGLLSRVYLYMGGTVASPDAALNQLAVTYADSTLNHNGNRFALADAITYNKMFGDDETGTLGKGSYAANKEIIFAYDNNLSATSIGRIFHYDAEYNVGADYLPSAEFKQLLAPADVRRSFLKVNASSTFTETTKWLCRNIAWLTYAPEIFVRTGEIYLNRAEANAKLGQYELAKADLKLIHVRAGLPALEIDVLSNQEVLPAVLKERRIELAFESHGSFDYFRNGLPLTRDAVDNNGVAKTVNPDDASVVFPLPSRQ